MSRGRAARPRREPGHAFRSKTGTNHEQQQFAVEDAELLAGFPPNLVGMGRPMKIGAHARWKQLESLGRSPAGLHVERLFRFRLQQNPRVPARGEKTPSSSRANVR